MIIAHVTWKCFGIEDIEDAFTQLGHSVVEIEYDDKSEPSDTSAIAKMQKQIEETKSNLVFSFNFFPVLAIACKNLDLPYFSWIYDSPYVRIYHYSVAFPTNHIFVFDSAVALEFRQAGIQTVHYLPMAANVDRLGLMTDYAMFHQSKWKNQHEIAFVGSLYTEKHNFYQRMDGISEYTRGYLEGLIHAQKLVYGYNFIQDNLKNRPEIMEDMRKFLPMTPGSDSVETLEFLFAQYVVNRQLTAIERKEILANVSEKYGLDLYTPDQTLQMKGCSNHGPVDYYDMAPYVFRTAKINLNISLRSIINGIPLRAFDIMGAGGFLMTNYQNDFMNLFVPGEDFVFFESLKDLNDKISYYLNNEKERIEIAENGFRKIVEQHTYRHRVAEMLSFL